VRRSGSGELTGTRFLCGVPHSPFAGGLGHARQILADRFGHPALRFHQLRVLGPLLAGRHVLAVLPTGAGKSLCYQLPALLAEGLTLVVSPLISLMQDQVATLRRRGITAAYLNSLLTRDERRTILDAALDRRLKLLYCAPERLGSLVRRFSRAERAVSLMAVDEAHCIVEWGNEFRPVYRRLGQYRYLLGDPVTIALTGSATPATRAEILRQLRLPQAEVVITSFDRPNLEFAVERVHDDRARFARLRQLIRTADGHTIVYAPTRRLTELVTRALLRMGVRAAPYHAGLSARTRRQVLVWFLRDRVPVVVATSAFGMGIDKPDVRRVIHWGPPHSVEAYYQEAGRAGRDGRRAECVILWKPDDFEWGEGAPEVRRYVEARGCRRRMLLEYFGEIAVECAGCDWCGSRDLASSVPAYRGGHPHPFVWLRLRHRGRQIP
jgi:ATP-dependent DNA helicase RecQ